MYARQILHVDLDAFFASVEQALDPRLVGLPVIVGGNPGTRGVVASSSYEARAKGVKTAMPLSQAYRLCPEAIFLPGRYNYYQAFSKQFMAILSDFSPDVEPFSLDEAWVDLTGFEPFYGSAEAAATTIRQRVSDELGITASIGVSTSKVVSKVASEFRKPNGLCVVPPGEEAAFLAPMPVRDLPLVGASTEIKLRQYGIKTIGQLAALSPAFLHTMLGAMGDVLHRLALGIDSATFHINTEAAKSVSRNTTLAENTLDRRQLHSLLYYLSERVAAQLRTNRQQARSPVLRLRYSDFDTITRHRTLSEPTDDQQVLYHNAVELLDEALANKTQLVRLMGVAAEQLVEGSAQLRLFDSNYLKSKQLNSTLDKLRGRYGYPAVQKGSTFALDGNFPHEREMAFAKTARLSK